MSLLGILREARIPLSAPTHRRRTAHIKIAAVIDPFGNRFGVIENPHFNPASVSQIMRLNISSV
jgi:hypothetical protein